MERNIQERVVKAIDENLGELLAIRTDLYRHPEVGGEEVRTSQILVESLLAHGFSVERGLSNLPTSFRGVFDSGKPGPVIGLMCEYDALPETGHSCGHNLICTISLGAAYGIQSVISELGGRVVVYGTPGEECVCSKVQMTAEGIFDEADVALICHPNPWTETGSATLAIDSIQIEFFGKSSHAGQAPEKGINALDAAVMCYSSIAMEKQYLKGTNIYGVINEGGQKASVIPEYASMKFLVRARTVKDLVQIVDMLNRCADSAAKVTGATAKVWRNEPANADVLSNQTMTRVFDKYYTELGETEIRKPEVNTGSTDMGDVSYRIPSIHPWLGLNCPEAQLHNKAFAEMTVSPEGDRVLGMGSKAMALAACEILSSPELLAEIKAEFKAQIEE